MKKRLYLAFSFKQLLLCTITGMLALSMVFALDLYYVNTVASAASDLPVIIIDAGHGGEDGGTQSVSGILEKDINLSISLKVDALFQLLGFETILVREGDYLIYDFSSTTISEKKVSDIHNRMAIMTNNPNSIFLSIHQNYFEQSQYSGAQVFYSGNTEESEIIAGFLQDSIVTSLQVDNTREIKQSTTDIYLLYYAQSPAVMVECGFLSNEEEAQLLSDEQYQQQMATAIVSGIINYLNNQEI